MSENISDIFKYHFADLFNQLGVLINNSDIRLTYSDENEEGIETFCYIQSSQNPLLTTKFKDLSLEDKIKILDEISNLFITGESYLGFCQTFFRTFQDYLRTHSCSLDLFYSNKEHLNYVVEDFTEFSVAGMNMYNKNDFIVYPASRNEIKSCIMTSSEKSYITNLTRSLFRLNSQTLFGASVPSYMDDEGNDHFGSIIDRMFYVQSFIVPYLREHSHYSSVFNLAKKTNNFVFLNSFWNHIPTNIMMDSEGSVASPENMKKMFIFSIEEMIDFSIDLMILSGTLKDYGSHMVLIGHSLFNEISPIKEMDTYNFVLFRYLDYYDHQNSDLHQEKLDALYSIKTNVENKLKLVISVSETVKEQINQAKFSILLQQAEIFKRKLSEMPPPKVIEFKNEYSW